MIKNKTLILIKLGGSVITDKSKPFTARERVISRLAKIIKKTYINSDTDLIIGHGGGSFPHVPANKFKTQLGNINKQSLKGFCLTADAAIQINRIVMTKILKAEIKAVSFAPLSFIFDGQADIKNIEKALKIGLVPVVYGDVVLNTKQNDFEIYSGEKIIDLLVSKLARDYKKIQIIYYVDTPGVLDSHGKTIETITPRNFSKIAGFLTGSKNTDVTGGMLHKVKESLTLVQKFDVEVYIRNGLGRGNFTSVLRA